MEEHLCDEVQCEDVANAVHISSYHFQKEYVSRKKDCLLEMM